MPKLYSSAAIARILLREGFLFISQRGSHQKYRSVKKPIRTVILPAKKRQIPHGTFRSILRQSGLTEEDFKK